MEDRTFDIIVAGGGMSGVSAAITAARKGKSVLLIEQNSMLGGIATMGAITAANGTKTHFGGLGLELMERLAAMGGMHKITSYTDMPYDNEYMKLLLDEMVLEAGVTVLLYTKITDLTKRNGRITKLELSDQMGKHSVSGKIFIDCTGDAMLAYYAGEKLILGDEAGNTQAPTLAACYINIDHARYHNFLNERYHGSKNEMIHDLIPKAVLAGDIEIEDHHHPGIFKINDTISLANVGHIYGADCLSGEGLTAATMEGRRQARKYFEFYQKYVPGFEHAYMILTGATLGIRESRRLNGQYIVTLEDKAQYRKFDDSVMRIDGGSGSDIHASSPDKEAYMKYYTRFTDHTKDNENDWATLPYRSLLPQRTDNLLVAGRCLSADRVVQGQIRLIGCCLVMGQIAGTAAAISMDTDMVPEKADIKRLQSTLRSEGIDN